MSQKLLVSALLLALGAGGGYWAAKQTTTGTAAKEKTPLYWVNPMDPRDKRDAPAKDNMGMDFIPVYEEQKNGSPGTVTISPEIQQNLGGAARQGREAPHPPADRDGGLRRL